MKPDTIERFLLVWAYFMSGQSIAFHAVLLAGATVRTGAEGFGMLLFFASVAFSAIIWHELFTYLIPFIKNGEKKDDDDDRQARK